MISAGICEVISGSWHAWLALFRLVVEILECIDLIFACLNNRFTK